VRDEENKFGDMSSRQMKVITEVSFIVGPDSDEEVSSDEDGDYPRPDDTVPLGDDAEVVDLYQADVEEDALFADMFSSDIEEDPDDLSILQTDLLSRDYTKIMAPKVKGKLCGCKKGCLPNRCGCRRRGTLCIGCNCVEPCSNQPIVTNNTQPLDSLDEDVDPEPMVDSVAPVAEAVPEPPKKKRRYTGMCRCNHRRKGDCKNMYCICKENGQFCTKDCKCTSFCQNQEPKKPPSALSRDIVETASESAMIDLLPSDVARPIPGMSAEEFNAAKRALYESLGIDSGESSTANQHIQQLAPQSTQQPTQQPSSAQV